MQELLLWQKAEKRLHKKFAPLRPSFPCSAALAYTTAPRLHHARLTLCPAPTDPVGQSWPRGQLWPTGSVYVCSLRGCACGRVGEAA